MWAVVEKSTFVEKYRSYIFYWRIRVKKQQQVLHITQRVHVQNTEYSSSIYWIRLTEYTRSISFYFGEKAPGINVELIQKYVANDLQSIGNNFTRAL